MTTKVIALDVYGTMLPGMIFPHNRFFLRKGVQEFVDKYKKNLLRVVTVSDARIADVRRDLRQAGFSVDLLEGIFCINEYPKDYSGIIDFYKIQPRELFVIGNDFEKDLRWAKEHGCSTLLVPSFNSPNDAFDFASIRVP